MSAHQIEHDPLCALPSLLALTRRAEAQGPAPRWPQRDDLCAILAIDPILALRAMRVAAAPILGNAALEDATPRQLLQKLGSGVISRMASTPATALESCDEVLALWRHAIASSAAARKLAELESFASGVDPELAAFCALTHDLPRWTKVLARARGLAPSTQGPLSWTRAWRLPVAVQVTWLAAHCGTTETVLHGDLARTVIAAEALALLAGYPHASSPGMAECELLSEIDSEGRDQLVEDVRSEVARLLEDVGLDEEMLGAASNVGSIMQARRTTAPPIEDGIVKLLELGNSERYRPVLASLVAGACHYLDADRAFFVQWVGKRQTLLIRSKYDRSAVPIGCRLVRPSPAEAALMGKAAGLEGPAVLEREENFRYRLLDHLGCDSMLVAPVLGGGGCHGLLLLDRSYSANTAFPPETATRAMALAGISGQTMNALHLKRMGRRSAKEARIDALTGLLNRRAALDQLEREIQRMKRKEQPMAVMMLDLDHFKETNDRFGHLTGDRVLASVGRVLRDTLRSSDTAGRYGGEEFVVMQFDTSIEEATVVAARIYKAVEDAGTELEVPITISIGLTDLRPEDSVESLLRRADQALYASKRRGRNRFSIDSQ